MTLIPALTIGALAALMLGYLVIVLSRALSFNPILFFQKRKFAQRAKALQEIDSAIENAHYAQAQSLLLQQLSFEKRPKNHEMAEAICAHNLSILGRFVALAEKKGGHIPNLALLEGLFVSRRELLGVLAEIDSNKRTIYQKRSEEGKQTPAWAEHEFKRKVDDLIDKLNTNEHSLRSQLKELTLALDNMDQQSSVTYH